MNYAYVGPFTGPGGPTYPPQTDGDIHVVGIATGTDRIVLKGSALDPASRETYGVWGIVQYAAEGIYIEKQAYASEGIRGLWLVNPDTGTSRQVLPESVRNFSFGSGAAWTGNEPYTNTTVFRVDLTTGVSSEWFTKPTAWLWYEGSDASGRPLVMWQQDPPAASEIWVLTGPSQGSRLYSGSKDEMPFLPQVTDSHGVWSGSSNGRNLWLLNLDEKFVKVADTPVQPVGKCQ
jgi:hypothetical protein